MSIYSHKVQYYETDQMKVVHHSNYVRWFEEARTHILDEGGMPYAKMEEMGIICPVMGVNVKYHTMTKFGETVIIPTILKVYNGVKMEFSYEIRDAATKELRCSGSSVHCFVDNAHKLMNLKKSFPEIHETLCRVADEYSKMP